MKIIVSKYIPFKGYKAMAIMPYIIIRRDQMLNFKERDMTHEEIHIKQQQELLWIFFFILYGLEYIVKYPFYRGKTYRNLSFEREAYANEDNYDYIKTRRLYSWINYIK